jgi:tetratricopeptide (TPR) repeat protein
MYASVLNKLCMNERALKYAKKGIRLALNNRNYGYLFTLQTQTAMIYEKLGDLESAERYYLKALDLEPSLLGEERLFPFAFVHFAELLIGKQRWKKAKQLIERSMQICRENKDNLLLVQSLLVFGEWYIQQDQYLQAIPFCLEAEEISRKYTFEKLTSRSMSSLCTCYDALQDERNFLKYATKLYRLERGVS